VHQTPRQGRRNRRVSGLKSKLDREELVALGDAVAAEKKKKRS